jgi:SAM-dependent methyltransferase
VREVSEGYTTRREELGAIAGSPRALAARVAFFLPRDTPKIGWPLAELARRDLLPRRPLRVLDLGAGVGATAIGVGRFVRARELAPSIEVTAVDRDDAALDALGRVVERALDLGSVPIELETRTADFASMRPSGQFDLVVFGLSLNEVGSDAREAIDRAAQLCAPDGAIVVIEPALRETTRALMALRDEIAGTSLSIFAPCVRRGPCPMLASERDWCHAEIALGLPPPLVAIARAAGLRYERLTFSYLTLRRDRAELAADHGPVVGRIVSEPLVSKGKRELVACTEGGLVRIRRLDRRRSGSNGAFDDLARGDVVSWDGEPDLAAESSIARLETR